MSHQEMVISLTVRYAHMIVKCAVYQIQAILFATHAMMAITLMEQPAQDVIHHAKHVHQRIRVNLALKVIYLKDHRAVLYVHHHVPHVVKQLIHVLHAKMDLF